MLAFMNGSSIDLHGTAVLKTLNYKLSKTNWQGEKLRTLGPDFQIDMSFFAPLY